MVIIGKLISFVTNGFVSDMVIDHCGLCSGKFRQVLMSSIYCSNRPRQVIDWKAAKSLRLKS